MPHNITIGTDPAASADIQAALIRNDVKTGVAQPPGDHVRYVDQKGPDTGPTAWKAPGELNASGQGNCNSIPRAAAPFVDASHVGVVPVPQADGTVVHHTFLIADAKPGEPGIKVGGDGKAIGGIPASRIIDPSIPKGMNGGQPLPAEVYQGAALSPIWPAHTDDLSHVYAPPADRAAEGLSFQGGPRLHVPTTDEGATVAAVSHLAARVVTPPPEHEPRPMSELYPAHPILSELGKLEDEGKRFVGWPTTLKMAEQYHAGLSAIAAGQNPAPLSSDPPITDEHKAIAHVMRGHLETIAGAARGEAAPLAKIADHAAYLQSGDPTDPIRDAHRTMVSEVNAMLPGVTPHALRKHLVCEELVPFFGMGDDRDDDFGGAMDLALGEALSMWGVGCPTDGMRPPRPPRQLDPRMGAGPAPSVPAGGGARVASPAMNVTPAGGGAPGPSAPHEDGSERHGDRDGFGGRGFPWRRGGGEGIGLELDSGDDDDSDDDSTVVSERVIDIPGQPAAPTVIQVPGETRYVPVAVPGQPTVIQAAPPTVGFFSWQRRPSAPAWETAGFGGHVGHGGRLSAGPGYNVYGGSAAGEARAQSRAVGIGNTLRAANANPATTRAQASALIAGASKNLASVIHNDPNMQGFGDWFGYRHDPVFARPDRFVVGSGRPIRLVSDRYRTDPWVRARLDAGGAVDGVSLLDVQGLLAPAVLDPSMGKGTYGGGWKGAGYGGGFFAQQQNALAQQQAIAQAAQNAAAQQQAIAQAAQNAAAQQQAIDAASMPALLPPPGFDPSLSGGFPWRRGEEGKRDELAEMVAASAGYPATPTCFTGTCGR